MATKSQEILLKGNTTNASAVPSSLKVREIAINALDRSLFTNDGNSIVKLYTGTNKWFDVNGNANNALKLGGILASEYINKEAFNSHINNSVIHITANERTAWNNKWDYNEETIKEVKVNAAGSADKLTSDAGTSAIPIYFKNGKPAQCIPSDLFSIFDNAYSSTGEHSLGITIAGYTKMVVVAYSTLSEKANKLATPRTLWGKPFDGSADVSGDLKDVGNITASGKATIQGDIVCGGEVVAIAGEGTPVGVTDYSALTGKPAINGVTLVSGNNTLVSLGIQPAGDYATNSGVTTLLADYATKTFVSNNYVGKSAFNTHAADTDIHVTSSDRMYWNTKWEFDAETIKAVKVDAASSADSVAWSGISGKPSTFTPSAHTHTASEVSGLPTSLKNPYALTFGSKTYDGSAAATITASDLGALTAHQSIYALTLQVNGTSKGVYNPASAAKTINIAVPTKTSDITNDSGFITSTAIPTALKNPYAVEVKANGVSLGTYDGSAVATFNLSAANVGAANKVHTHTASDISGLPTKLSAFTNDVGFITGITKPMVEGVLTGNITSHTHTFASLTSKPTTIAGYGITDAYTATTIDSKLSGYLPLSGGTLTTIGTNDIPLVLKTDSSTAWLKFQTADNKNSYIGVSNGNKFYFQYDAKSNVVLHSGNYNSYSPTLTGTGATGTWGISISGNAATATNADTLDNLHAADFAKVKTHIVSGTDVNSIGYGVTDDGNMYYGPMATFGTADYFIEIQSPYNKPELYYRQYNTNGYSDKKQIAFTDSNVASATKLQDNTAFTAWGQTFFENGKPKNVSGDLSMEQSIIYWNGDINGSYISSFGMTEMTYNMRDGHRFCVNRDIILRITRFGNVLIGPAADEGYKLDVNGKSRITGDLIVEGEVSALVA